MHIHFSALHRFLKVLFFFKWKFNAEVFVFFLCRWFILWLFQLHREMRIILGEAKTMHDFLHNLRFLQPSVSCIHREATNINFLVHFNKSSAPSFLWLSAHTSHSYCMCPLGEILFLIFILFAGLKTNVLRAYLMHTFGNCILV